MEISEVAYRAPDLEAVRRFYRECFGMVETPSPQALRLGFPGAATKLAFTPGPPIPAEPGAGIYWKIGITLRDLDHAVDWLRSEGVDVSQPAQFRDIGYLCHLRDPAGRTVELLQQGFEGRAADAGAGHAIAGQGTLAHLTVRARNLAAAEDLFLTELGLRRLSRQPVPDRGFDLHFFAGSSETPPDPDLTAVANREWLWRRPYATIEVQHLTEVGPPLAPAAASGFVCATFSNGAVVSAERLSALG